MTEHNDNPITQPEQPASPQTPAQQQTAERLIGELRRRGYDVVTEVTPAGRFWPAEDYHQQYYKRKGTLPYCHAYTKRF